MFWFQLMYALNCNIKRILRLQLAEIIDEKSCILGVFANSSNIKLMRTCSLWLSSLGASNIHFFITLFNKYIHQSGVSVFSSDIIMNVAIFFRLILLKLKSMSDANIILHSASFDVKILVSWSNNERKNPRVFFCVWPSHRSHIIIFDNFHDVSWWDRSKQLWKY